MLLRGQQVHYEENDRLQIHLSRLIPEGVFVVHPRAESLSQFFNILFIVVVSVLVEFNVLAFPDIGQGVVAPGGLSHVCEVQMHDFVAVLFQMLPIQPAKVPFGVGHDQVVLGVEDIGHYIAPGFACSSRAYQQIVVVDARGPGVVAGEDVLRKDTFGFDVVIHFFPPVFVDFQSFYVVIPLYQVPGFVSVIFT